MTMKLLHIAAAAALLVLPVFSSADGNPQELKIIALENRVFELEQDNIALRREILELSSANTNANRASPELGQANEDLGDDSTVAATSISRDASLGLNGGEFYASDEAASFTFSRFGPILNLGNSRTEAGFIFSESRDFVVIGGLFYDVQPRILPGLELSFGVKTYGALLGIEDEDAIAIGGAIEARYPLSALPGVDGVFENFPITLSGGLGVAPDILSFGDSVRVIDWFARVGVEASESVDVFFGFRFLQFNTQPGDTEVDDRFHLGVRWRF